MNKGLRLSLLSVFCITALCWGNKAMAQLLPPNQPEQNACQALQLCGNTFTSPYGYQGTGTVFDLSNTPCLGGEANSMWLRLEITTPGILVFSIAPLVTTDDYDMAVVDITTAGCENTNTAPVIRCNFNNNLPAYNNGIIGLNTTSTVQFVTSGFTGNSYLQQINANAGDVYLIMINNFGTGFSGPMSGFTIDFTGSTATFNQPPPPELQQILPYCDLSQQLTVQLNTNVLCSSIAPDGSDFHLTPGGSIASVSGLNCTSTSGYTNKIKITFSSPLPNGDYSLHAQTGTDGNTLLGLCNSPLALPDSLNFHVGLDPIAFLSMDSPACQHLKINLNTPAACNSIAANGSDFTIVGPSAVSIASATGTGCTPGGFTSAVELTLSAPIAVDGLYKVRAQIGSDANTLIDSCGRILLPMTEIPFTVNSFNDILQAGPDTIICNMGSTVDLYAVNNGPPPPGGFNYSWSPTTGISNPNSASTQVVLPAIRSYYVLTTIDANGCYLRDSVTITVSPFHGELNPTKAEVCIGDPLPLLASGGTHYNWYDNPSMTGTPATLNCTTCPDPKALPPLGVTNYYVLITTDVGCKDTIKAEVTVNPKPVIESLPADTTIKYGESIVLHAFGGTFYSWSPVSTLSDGYVASPRATPRETTAYEVTGVNEYGCMALDTSIVRIDFRSPVLVPNAFSPNGDGLNDVFGVANFKFQKLLEFRVFDRWGKQVFETTNPARGWDGTIDGKAASSDVYYYYIRLGYGDDYVETFKGDVTLIR